MKKIKILLLLVITIFAFNIKVHAASGSLWVSTSSAYVGDSFTVSANISSAAAWNVHLSASGPVSGCTINQADATADAMDTNKTFSATCTATGTGTITVNLSGDVTSASDGNAVNISGSRTVTVSERPAPPSDNNNNNTNNNNTNNNSTNNNNTNNNTNNNVDNRSQNNKIKEITVDGHELTKVDENNYTLSVLTDVTNIKINATAEDPKSTITGAESHNLNIGDNNIQVIVTSESGLQNIINVKVTRKDGYYLEDLDLVLKKERIDNVSFIIKNDTVISSSILEKIKNSKKVFNFDYYSEDKKILYSLTIDGSKLKETKDFLTTLSDNPDGKKEMMKLSNYADNLYVSFKQKDFMPNGIKVKLYVGDKFSDGDIVNIYSYIKDSNKLKLVSDKNTVKDGYIVFDVKQASDYLVTMSTIPNLEKVPISKNKELTILQLVMGLGILLVIGIILILISKRKKNNKKEEPVTPTVTEPTPTVTEPTPTVPTPTPTVTEPAPNEENDIPVLNINDHINLTPSETTTLPTNDSVNTPTNEKLNNNPNTTFNQKTP